MLFPSHVYICNLGLRMDEELQKIGRCFRLLMSLYNLESCLVLKCGCNYVTGTLVLPHSQFCNIIFRSSQRKCAEFSYELLF